jgi:hypothetical protein
MKKIVFLVVVALAVPAAFAASFFGSKAGTASMLDDKAPMTGVWKCKMKFEGGQMPDVDAEMDLQQTGKDIKGTGSTSQGSAPMKGTFDDGKYKLTAETGDANWDLQGKLDGGKLVGTFAIPSAGVKGTSDCGKPEAKSDSAKSDKSSSASTTASLTGVWKCIAKAPDQPPSDFQLDLDVKDDKVTGTGSSAAGSAPLAGTYKDGKFALKLEAGDITIEFEGKLDSGKISGTLKMQGNTVPFDGTKGS